MKKPVAKAHRAALTHTPPDSAALIEKEIQTAGVRLVFRNRLGGGDDPSGGFNEWVHPALPRKGECEADRRYGKAIYRMRGHVAFIGLNQDGCRHSRRGITQRNGVPTPAAIAIGESGQHQAAIRGRADQGRRCGRIAGKKLEIVTRLAVVGGAQSGWQDGGEGERYCQCRKCNYGSSSG